MDSRAVSTTVSYVLSVAITAMLVAGLLLAGGDFVDDRRDQVVQTELRVIGHQVAADLGRVDRMVEAGDDVSTARVNQTFPERVTGNAYTITIRESPDSRVLVNTTNPDVEVRVRVRTTTQIEESSASGGTVSVFYDASNDRLEVENV